MPDTAVELDERDRGGTGLAAFPAELLKKVALFCDGSARIELGQTCRRLHCVCDDFVLVRESVATQLREHNGDDADLTRRQLDALNTRAQSDAGIWTRYSVALAEVDGLRGIKRELVARHEDLVNQRPEELRRLAEKMMAFMPQALAIGCTKICHYEAASFFAAIALGHEDGESAKLITPPGPMTAPRLRYLGLDESVLSRLAFCFAAESLGSSTVLLAPEPAADDDDDAYTFTGGDGDDLAAMLDGSPFLRFGEQLAFGLITGIADDGSRFYENQHARYFLVGLFSWVLGRLNGVRIPRLVVPLAASSLDHGADLPLPFDRPRPAVDDATDGGGGGGGGEWEHWLRLTQARFVTKAALEEGEWCGYRSSDPRLGSFRQMHLSRFAVEDGKTSCSVRATGTVGDLRFGLRGEVGKLDCRFDLRQEYGMYSARWCGFVTPFGLVGYWQAAHHSHEPIGFFWLWKKPKEDKS